MSYSSTLHIAIDSTGAEGQLKRLENRLELTDRAGDGAASSVSNVGLEADRMRNMVMRASGVLTGSAAAFGLMARQSSDAAREIKNLSRLAGADVVTFQKMTMASRAFGIEQEQLAQIMLDTQDRIGDFLQTGQGEFADFFEQIAGKSDLTAQALARMAGPEALQAIYNALEDANLSASETVFYMESLASDATRLIPLLKDNGAGFKEVADEAERLGVALSEIEIDQLTALRGEFADLEQIMSSSTSQIIAQYSGEITSTVNALGEGVRLLADNFDTLQDAATLAAGVMTARFVSAMAAGTASIAQKTAASIADARADAASAAATVRRTAAEKQTALALLSTTRLEVQATKGTAAHTFALQQLSVARTRAATAAGAHTAAMNAATAATARASVAARGLRGALALVGGPLGLLVGAAGLLYVFRDELNLTGARIGLTEEELASLREEMADMSQEDLSQSLSSLNSALDTATIKAATAREELASLRAEVGRGEGGMGVFREIDARHELADASNAVADAEARIVELEQKVNAARAETASRIEENANSFIVYGERLEEEREATALAAEVTKELSAAQEDGADKTYTLADAYESLLDRITPNRREARQYAQDLGTLNLALASGRMTTVQYMQAMGLLQESFQEAQRETDELANKTVDAVFDMEGAWDEVRLNGLRRLDDGIANMWQGAIDGSLDAGEAMKRIFSQTLAEMAHMAITRPIMVQIAGSMGMGGSGTGSTGMGGFDLSPSGISNAWNMVQNGFTGNGIGSGMASAANSAYSFFSGASGASALAMEGGLSSAAITSANQVASNPSWLNNPSNVSNISMGLQSIGGSYVGNELGSSMFGKQAKSNIGSTVGAIAGSFLPIPGGTFIGATLGGMVDSLFGSDSDPRAYYTTGDDVNWGGYGSPFGEWGFHAQDMSTEDMEGLGELAKGMTELDMALASMMTDDQIAGATQRMVEFNANTGEILGSLEQMSRDRLAAIMDGVTDYTEQLTAQNASLEGLAEASVNVLQFSNAVDEFNAQIQADAAALLQSSDNVGAQAAGLVTALNAVELLDNGVERMGFTFDSAAEGAIHHAYAMQEAAGGMENLNALTSSYYQNYFTEAEREAHLRAELTDSMRELGFELPRSREGFRALVEAQNQNTAAGAETFLALLNLEGAFAQLTPAADTAASSVNNAANALAPVESAWSAFNKSVDAERQILDAAHRDTTASIRSNMQTVQEAMRQTESAAQSLNNALRQTQSGTMFAREQGQATLRRMLAAGEVTDQRELDNALSAVAEPSEQLFGSFLDYQRDFVGTAHDIYNLSQLTDDQLSTEEQSLAALEKQLRNADLQHSREMARFDNLLMDQAAIIEAEFGTQSWLSSVNDSVLSVEEAVKNIRISMPSGGGGGGGAFGSGGGFGGSAGSVGGALGGSVDPITQAYRDILGRDPDPEGYAYFQGDLDSGQSISDIRNSLEQNKAQGNYATGAWQLERDQLAMVHKNEFIAPDRGGIADEFRAYAAGDYQRELMSELGSIQRALPMPQLPAMPLFNQQNISGSGDMTVLIKRVETLVSNADTQQGMQREALKALKSLVRQLERWDDQDRVRVSVEATV